MSQRNNVNTEFTSPNKFIELLDIAPHNYVGDAGKVYRVNAGETGLEPVSIGSAIIGALKEGTIPVAGDGTAGHILENSTATIDVDGIHINNKLYVGSGLDEWSLPTTKGMADYILTSAGDGSSSWQVSGGGGSTIGALVITNSGQTIAAGVQTPIVGTVSASYGLSGWSSNTFTSDGGGLYEVNISFCVQVGGSPNNSFYTVVNGGSPVLVLGYLTIGTSSYSSIYNLADTDTLNFLFENDDGALDANIYNMTMTIKRINNYLP